MASTVAATAVRCVAQPRKGEFGRVRAGGKRPGVLSAGAAESSPARRTVVLGATNEEGVEGVVREYDNLMGMYERNSIATQTSTELAARLSGTQYTVEEEELIEIDPYSSEALDYIGSPSQTMKVRFTLHYQTRFGENVCLLGSHEKMGAWDHSRAVNLNYGEGGIWSVELELPMGGVHFYKYVVRTVFGLRWQEGANSMLVLPEESECPAGSVYMVDDNFDGEPNSLAQTSQTLLAAKLVKSENEKREARNAARRAQQVTNAALSELLLAREELARMQQIIIENNLMLPDVDSSSEKKNGKNGASGGSSFAFTDVTDSNPR